MDHFNALSVGRSVVMFLMPARAGSPAGSVALSIEQARALADRLVESALVAENAPLSGAEAVAECTGADPRQLRISGVL